MPSPADFAGERNTALTIKGWFGSGSVDIFGKPYSGKDTHSEILAPEFNAAVLGAGKKLREDGDLAEADRAWMDAGGLIPSNAFFANMLRQFYDPNLAGKPLFLTAVGRMAGEPAPVMGMLDSTGHPLRAVIHIVISDDIARERLAKKIESGSLIRGNRKDDTPEALETRLEEFNARTLPAIDEFRDLLGEVIEIDGDAPRPLVTANIKSELARLAGATRP